MTANPAHPDSPSAVPGHHLTANQLIGYNMARWRTAAGLTQAELGEMLGGWTHTAVSAAENSWKGKRVRKFTGDDILNIATALRLPIAALFLPPEDDGAKVAYKFHAQEQGGSCEDMTVMFGLLIPDLMGDGPAEHAWQAALADAAGRYLDRERTTALAAYLDEMEPAERRHLDAGRFRAHRAALLALLGDVDQIAYAIETEDRSEAVQ